jgi:hypothetical protein
MQAVVVAPGGGRFIAVGSAGTGVTVKVSAAETDGLCTVWEGRVPPGTMGAGPHESHTAQAGTFAFIPRETIHGFHNASEESATLLVVHHPAGFEQFLEEMQKLAARHGSSDERAALAVRFDMIPASHALPSSTWAPSEARVRESLD